MVFFKTEIKNKITYPDGNKYTLPLQNIMDLTGKLLVLSLILSLGYPKFWNYINGNDILVKPIYFKMVFTVCTFIIMVLYFILISNSDRSNLDILFSCIVLVYVIYIWTKKVNNKLTNIINNRNRNRSEGFITMGKFDEEDMDLIHSKKEKGYNKGIGMYPIEKSYNKKDLVFGLNKPEHYDFTPDDIPTFQLNDELKVFKHMDYMNKNDSNANWSNQVKGYNPSFVPVIEGGFPFYDNKEKVHDLFNNKHPHQEWNDIVLTALIDTPRTPLHLLDKSGDGLPGIKQLNIKSGRGQSKYTYLEENEEDINNNINIENENEIQIPNIMNEYNCDSDEINFKIGDNSMNINQGCTNYPIPGFSNLKKINDNTAYGIEQIE